MERVPPPWLSLARIVFNGAGILVMPFVVALVASMFLEVSQVAETAPALFFFTVLFLFPVFLMQIVGLTRKVRIELAQVRAMRRDRGQSDRLATEVWLAIIARHASVITPRGWSLFWAGLVFLVAALAFKWGDLGLVATIGLLLFYGLVGLTSFLSAFLTRGFSRASELRQSSIRREMSPAVIVSGEPGEERFHLIGIPVPPGYHLLIEDMLPAELGTETRHVIGSGVRTQEAIVSGRLRKSPRGLHRLGPATIGYQDVLGLTRVSVAAVATCELKVLPRFHRLDIIEPPRSRQQTPDVVVRPHRFPNEDFFRFREYARGDDTRRIHWKLSVRTGRLQVRQPESREQSMRNVVLVLDTFLPNAGQYDAVALSDVLDRLVETWISLAAELVDRGESVTMVTAVDDGRGQLSIESVGGRSPRPRWQDLGARARYQDRFDVPALLEHVGKATDGVAVSARFDVPPPLPLHGDQRFTWIYFPPDEALGPVEPPFWHQFLGGSESWRWPNHIFRLPFPAGSDENGFWAQRRRLNEARTRYAARQSIRQRFRYAGGRMIAALSSRGDAVYKLTPGPVAHRLLGVSAGQARGLAA